MVPVTPLVFCKSRLFPALSITVLIYLPPKGFSVSHRVGRGVFLGLAKSYIVARDRLQSKLGRGCHVESQMNCSKPVTKMDISSFLYLVYLSNRSVFKNEHNL